VNANKIGRTWEATNHSIIKIVRECPLLQFSAWVSGGPLSCFLWQLIIYKAIWPDRFPACLRDRDTKKYMTSSDTLLKGVFKYIN